MSKFLNRAIKYGYLKRTRGKAAAERYMESCFAYDAMRVAGVTGTSAWIIRQEQLRKRREKRHAGSARVIREAREGGRFWRPLAYWAILIFLGFHSTWLAIGFLILLAIIPSKSRKSH